MSINPLSNPKGVKLLCELCQKPAFVECTKCRVTYYCGVEHQRADWVGIHEKICQLLIPLRTALPFYSSEKERKLAEHNLATQKRQLIELTRTTSQKLLFEGRHEEAVPSGMQSLRFAIDVYGLASIELVPSYLTLGEACTGIGQLTQADEYLSQAQWTVLKTPNCSNTIKSKLYRNIGLLYAAKGDFEESLYNFANDIYYASEEFGTHDIHTSGGYFHMGNVFLRQNKMDVANSLFEQVIDIWLTFLGLIVRIRTSATKTTSTIGPVRVEKREDEPELDEAQQAEAVLVLNNIFDLYDVGQPSSRKPETRAKAALALAMLYFVLGNLDKAKELGRKAVVASEGSSDETFCRGIVEFMKICERVA